MAPTESALPVNKIILNQEGKLVGELRCGFLSIREASYLFAHNQWRAICGFNMMQLSKCMSDKTNRILGKPGRQPDCANRQASKLR